MLLKNLLTELLNMVWDVYWPLALGFLLSAFVRAYVPSSTIAAHVGRPDLKGLSLSVLFGALSSSCSYAAVSMGRTLIVKGASWANAIAFMVASTNLVFEIFLVIVMLLGWPFFVGEIIGGLLLIGVGTLLIRWLLNMRSIEEAKRHMQEQEAQILHQDPHAHHHVHTHHDHAGHTEHTHHHSAGSTRWQDAMMYFYMDVSMVGKDILLGVVIAAMLAAVVPPQVWTALFLKNQTQLPLFVITLWNAVVGILVAVFSFVCSVGNILLAAVLWHGGINFGGVIAFIFSDLVTLPILLVYQRYFGKQMMLRLFFILSLSILITGVGTDYLFQALGWIPSHPATTAKLHMPSLAWNYKTILNLIFIPLSVVAYFIGKVKTKV
ncbi:MAG: permease [Thermoflavifilum aggregans]|nr:permease [Thermoflavifilum aggregans]